MALFDDLLNNLLARITPALPGNQRYASAFLPGGASGVKVNIGNGVMVPLGDLILNTGENPRMYGNPSFAMSSPPGQAPSGTLTMKSVDPTSFTLNGATIGNLMQPRGHYTNPDDPNSYVIDNPTWLDYYLNEFKAGRLSPEYSPVYDTHTYDWSGLTRPTATLGLRDLASSILSRQQATPALGLFASQNPTDNTTPDIGWLQTDLNRRLGELSSWGAPLGSFRAPRYVG